MSPLIYQDAEHYDLIASWTAPADLGFYEGLVAEHGGPVLELGCGTGRIALPLAAAGAEVVGLDRSAELLAHARIKAEASSIPIALHQGDFTSFDLGRRFALVVIPYNAFNHLLTIADLESFFACVARHLLPAGRLVIDTFNPDPAALAVNPEREQRILEYLDPSTGSPVVMYEKNAYDPARQVNTVRWIYRAPDGRTVRADELEMRIFFPQELDAWLWLSGFTIEKKHGDYDGRPFSARTPKQLVVCRLNPRPAPPDPAAGRS